jgi:hypothetical protein
MKMGITYYLLRLRDTLFPPKSLPDLWAYSARSKKYSYMAEHEQEEIRKKFKKIRNN